MISWPSVSLPPINLYTVPLLGQTSNTETATRVNNKMDKSTRETNILFVCAQGRLRSATAMHLMNRIYGYNTRCCGIDETALIPLNPMRRIWADMIYVMEEYMLQYVQDGLDNHGIYTVPKCLGIPDEYEYMDEELCQLIQKRFFSV